MDDVAFGWIWVVSVALIVAFTLGMCGYSEYTRYEDARWCWKRAVEASATPEQAKQAQDLCIQGRPR